MPVNFDPTYPSFSIQNAYFLAKASAAAYADGTEFDNLALELGLKTIKAPKVLVNDIRYFIGSTDTFAILAFRGTVVNDIHNWLTDATFAQVSNYIGGGGMVHAGFAKALFGEWAEILGMIKLLDTKAQPLWIAGHSLGGGLASLASSGLAANGVIAKGVYTYGSPRVGDSDFYSSYLPVGYRFVNNCDIVPHVPPEVCAWGIKVCSYKHVGTLEYLDRHGNLGEGMSDWAVKKEFMLNEVASVSQDWDACIADHSLDKYINAIGQNLPVPPAPVTNVPADAIATAPNT